MALLEHKNKFQIENPKRGNSIAEPDFFRWSNKNFYRTSYNDMRSPVSARDFLFVFRSQLRTRTWLFLGIRAICPRLLQTTNSDRQSQKLPEESSIIRNLTINHSCSQLLGRFRFCDRSNIVIGSTPSESQSTTRLSTACHINLESQQLWTLTRIGR